MPRQYPQELRERAVRVVLEHRADYPTEWAAMKSIAAKLGIGTAESLRTWVRQAQVDAGTRPGVTTSESEEIARLKRENAGAGDCKTNGGSVIKRETPDV